MQFEDDQVVPVCKADQKECTVNCINLTKESLEWQVIEQLFHRSMNHTIEGIASIKNSWLLERYDYTKRRMEYKNSGIVSEKLLFHGTGQVNPNYIYLGEVGFDQRFCKRGRWGNASYFATSANYSDSYAHLSSSGSKQLLIAKVLTGYSWFCEQPNNELRMPPVRCTNYKLGNIVIPELRYDTVNAISKNVQIFMTYDSNITYPAYLLTYHNS